MKLLRLAHFIDPSYSNQHLDDVVEYVSDSISLLLKTMDISKDETLFAPVCKMLSKLSASNEEFSKKVTENLESVSNNLLK